jgi:hypothetical protein
MLGTASEFTGMESEISETRRRSDHAPYIFESENT